MRKSETKTPEMVKKHDRNVRALNYWTTSEMSFDVAHIGAKMGGVMKAIGNTAAC